MKIFQLILPGMLAAILNIISFSSFASEADYTTAVHYYQAGDYEKAAELFNRLRNGSEAALIQEKAAFSFALCQEALQNFDSARQTYTYILTNYPDSAFSSAAIKNLIDILLIATDFPKALRLLYQLEKTPDLTQTDLEKILALQIICFTKLKQYKNANNGIEKFSSRFPSSAFIPGFQLWQMWYNLSLSNFIETENLYNSISATITEPEIISRAKADYIIADLKTDHISRAAELMLSLVESNYKYSNSNLLWLAQYFSEIRELSSAGKILQKVIAESEDPLTTAIARKDLAAILTTRREFHDALSNYPLIKKDLIKATSSISQIEYLNKLADYSNVQTLRKLGSSWSALAILNQIRTDLEDPLYYNIMYEQGLIAFELGNTEEAAKKLMQVGILSTDPDLAGKSLLRCYEACKKINNIHLMNICLEELSGKNKGSYGQLYPNSPYTAQARELRNSLK